MPNIRRPGQKVGHTHTYQFHAVQAHAGHAHASHGNDTHSKAGNSKRLFTKIHIGRQTVMKDS